MKKFVSQFFKCNLKQSSSSGVRFYCALNVLETEKRESCGNSPDIDDKSSYYFEDGLRKVYPFYYQYSTFCKGRWIGKNIIDLYCSDTSVYPKEEINRRITSGVIKVNDKIVNSNYVLKNGDLITSAVHRHELAVLACPIQILFEDDDLLVVDKPPSIPVHPCGLYYKNTILSILANEYNKHDLYIVYRLDRLTSGVLLFAKSNKKSREIHKEMDMHNIKKEYVCRVEGNFPDGVTICNKPIKHFYNRVGTCLVHPEGKVAVTEFKKLSYNGKSSVVLCKPLTGRTHQIRVHLQYLGYPIINDPIYNSYAFGPFKGKNGIIGKTVSQLMNDLNKEHVIDLYTGKVSTCEENLHEKDDFLKFSIFKEFYRMNNKLSCSIKDNSKIVTDSNCFYCKLSTGDPEQLSLGMFLHACSYESGKWKFKSDMPFWTCKDWNIA